jgi:hypothetical protein
MAGQLARTHRALSQQRQNLAANRVGQGFEDGVDRHDKLLSSLC